MRLRLILTALILLLPVISRAADLQVRVQERAKVDKAEVTLGSIAHVQGKDRALVHKARKVSVHRFGAGESSWRISGRAVGHALWQAGVALDRVQMDIPIGAKVVRSTVRLDGDQVAAAVRQQLGRGAPAGVRVRVAFPDGPPSFDGLPAKGRIDAAPEGPGR
ncbi:MAG TPA: hypothetical protein VKA48_10705, partial [Gammaproteobacteria bacterium]|nr:hypothetical protein [Gammaproteobacteria bacterium]